MLPVRLSLQERIAKFKVGISTNFSPEWDRQIRNERQAEAQREFQARVDHYLSLSGIDERYSEAGFDVDEMLPDQQSRDQYRAIGKALMNLMNNPGIVALIGDVGGCKTSLACALVRECCKQGRPGKYITAETFMTSITETYKNALHKSEKQIIGELLAVDLLVLDELTGLKGSSHETEKMLALVCGRYDRQKSTLIVANVKTRTELLEQLDRRIADRIHDDAGGVIISKIQSVRGRLLKPNH